MGEAAVESVRYIDLIKLCALINYPVIGILLGCWNLAAVPKCRFLSTGLLPDDYLHMPGKHTAMAPCQHLMRDT